MAMMSGDLGMLNWDNLVSVFVKKYIFPQTKKHILCVHRSKFLSFVGSFLMKRVRLTLIWSGCIEFIFAKCPCLIWFPFRPDRIDVYRLIGDVGLVWWSSWRQATKQTNEGTNKESIGQSKDEYTCMCFIYYVMWMCRFIKSGMHVCLRTPMYSI